MTVLRAMPVLALINLLPLPDAYSLNSSLILYISIGLLDINYLGVLLQELPFIILQKQLILYLIIQGVTLPWPVGVNLKWPPGISLRWREGVCLRGFSSGWQYHWFCISIE